MSSRSLRCAVIASCVAHSQAASISSVGGILSAPGGQQTSSTCDLDQITSCAAEPFATGSEMLVDPVHKMIHCNMPKNADNGFRNMMCSLTKGHKPYENVSYYVFPEGSGLETYSSAYEVGCTAFSAQRCVGGAFSEERFSGAYPDERATSGTPFKRQSLRDMMWGKTDWIKSTFIRDPLSRFGSAWQSKCTEGSDSDGYVTCGMIFNKTAWAVGYSTEASWGYWSFDDAVEVMYRQMRHGADMPPSSIYQTPGDPMDPNNAMKQKVLGYREATLPWPLDHVRRQSEFCEGLMWTARGALDAIYLLDSETANANVIEMLTRANVPYPEAQPSVINAFPAPGESAPAAEARKGNSSAIPWTSDAAQKMLVAYKPDYLNFDLAVPPKYIDLAGEDFVTKLGLRTSGVKCGTCTAADPASYTEYEATSAASAASRSGVKASSSARRERARRMA